MNWHRRVPVKLWKLDCLYYNLRFFNTGKDVAIRNNRTFF